jgi:hypothetical protein
MPRKRSAEVRRRPQKMALTVDYSQSITTTQKFALVLTNNPKLARWQVHHPHCGDASDFLEQGGCLDFVAAKSAEQLVKSELHLYALAALPDSWSEGDFEVMPCCQG